MRISNQSTNSSPELNRNTMHINPNKSFHHQNTKKTQKNKRKNSKQKYTLQFLPLHIQHSNNVQNAIANEDLPQHHRLRTKKAENREAAPKAARKNSSDHQKKREGSQKKVTEEENMICSAAMEIRCACGSKHPRRHAITLAAP